MSKGATIDRLIESAIIIFARDGFEGASLREIATRADVPLSAINSYFGSKRDLYFEVENVVWQKISDERDALFAEVMASYDEPPLEKVLHALFYPIVSRMRGNGAESPLAEILRASVTIRRQIGFAPQRLKNYESRSEKWFAAINNAVSPMPRGQAIWIYSFTIGALFSFQLIDHWFDEMVDYTSDLDADTVTDLLVTFCSGGCAAIANRA